MSSSSLPLVSWGHLSMEVWTASVLVLTELAPSLFLFAPLFISLSVASLSYVFDSTLIFIALLSKLSFALSLSYFFITGDKVAD